MSKRETAVLETAKRGRTKTAAPPEPVEPIDAEDDDLSFDELDALDDADAGISNDDQAPSVPSEEPPAVEPAREDALLALDFVIYDDYIRIREIAGRPVCPGVLAQVKAAVEARLESIFPQVREKFLAADADLARLPELQQSYQNTLRDALAKQEEASALAAQVQSAKHSGESWRVAFRKSKEAREEAAELKDEAENLNAIISRRKAEAEESLHRLLAGHFQAMKAAALERWHELKTQVWDRPLRELLVEIDVEYQLWNITTKESVCRKYGSL